MREERPSAAASSPPYWHVKPIVSLAAQGSDRRCVGGSALYVTCSPRNIGGSGKDRAPDRRGMDYCGREYVVECVECAIRTGQAVCTAGVTSACEVRTRPARLGRQVDRPVAMLARHGHPTRPDSQRRIAGRGLGLLIGAGTWSMAKIFLLLVRDENSSSPPS